VTTRPRGEDAALLDAATVSRYLAGRGLVDDPEDTTARPLGGGVSNIVLAVSTKDRALVVKQSLPRLRVAEEWLASRDRVLTEATALELAARLTPGAVPLVLDCDPERFVMVMQRAPVDWRDWKTQLLHGEINAGVAGRLGHLLATWQTATTNRCLLGDRFADPAPFEELRIDPYYRTIMRRYPQQADRIAAVLERMAQQQVCLVHGDFSPKNVLVGQGDQLWVIDWEVAHLGDNAFDVAFLLNHLRLKSLHRPSWADRYCESARRFIDALIAGLTSDLAVDWRYVAEHIGCLMLARVDGKSPVEYLTDNQRQQARQLGMTLLRDPPTAPDQLWAAMR
jgi:5-methylthioribose kinase